MLDSHFSAALRYRLGMPTMPSTTCQQLSNHSCKTCGHQADSMGHHAVTCKIGGHQYAAHARGCHILQQAMEQAGYQTIREQVVPELATKKCPSPQLDLDAWCLELGERVVVDFTIRHPTAARYLGTDAMATACREKHRHYPAQAGVHVSAAAMEIYGRFSEELTGLLEMLAQRAQQRDRAFGHQPGRWLRRWRIQLSHAAASLIGRAVQLAHATRRTGL